MFQKLTFYIVFIFLLSPIIMLNSGFLDMEPLRGAFSKKKKPEITYENLIDGTYQSGLEQYVNSSCGHKNFFVRLYNQIRFSAFGLSSTKGVVEGKDGFLYDISYIHSYLGNDFLGEEYINSHTRKLKYIEEWMKYKKINFSFIVAPGKGSYVPEKIPEKYLKNKQAQSNYTYYTKRLKELDINHIDFNEYFNLLKDTSSYPLYSKYGIHWSEYGSFLALDSLVGYLSANCNLQKPTLNNLAITKSDTISKIDYDIALGMNLMFQLPSHIMGYPSFGIKPSESKKEQSLLIIGDSYYFNLQKFGILDSMFEKHDFWYYNKLVYKEGKNRGKLNYNKYTESIKKYDIVLLLTTERNMQNMGFGFIETLYNEIKPKSRRGINFLTSYFINKDPLLSKECHQAITQEKLKLSKAKALISNEYFDEYNDYKKYKNAKLENIKNQLLRTNSQRSSILSKCKKNHKKYIDQLSSDALWIYNNSCPIIKEKEKIVKDAKAKMLSNDKMIKSLRSKAKKSMISFEEMIEKDSYWYFRNQYRKEFLEEDKALQRVNLNRGNELWPLFRAKSL